MIEIYFSGKRVRGKGGGGGEIVGVDEEARQKVAS